MQDHTLISSRVAHHQGPFNPSLCMMKCLGQWHPLSSNSQCGTFSQNPKKWPLCPTLPTIGLVSKILDIFLYSQHSHRTSNTRLFYRTESLVVLLISVSCKGVPKDMHLVWKRMCLWNCLVLVLFEAVPTPAVDKTLVPIYLVLDADSGSQQTRDCCTQEISKAF